jgi:acyl carrier protein
MTTVFLSNQAIAERVTELIKANFPASTADATNATTLQQIGLDSLDVVDLVWTIESDFDIKFTDEDLQKISSIETLVELIGGKLTS